MGIVRVEQELARRARVLLGDDVAFCVYVRSQNRFIIIDDEAVSRVLAGRLQIDFSPELDQASSRLAPVKRFLQALRGRIRRAMRTNVTLYQAFQRLRGRRYTREEILQFQREEFGPPPELRLPRVENLRCVSCGPAKLGPDSCIISAGLDWQYKDLRAIWALKQVHHFRYCAVVYDLIPLLFPHFVTPGYDTFLADYFGELMWVVDCVMCISKTVREEWMDFCGSFNVSAPSHVFSLGCDLPAAALETLPERVQGKRFALFVSTIEPRKNHRVLYEAWDRCIRSGMVDPSRNCLVFVGRIGWAVHDLTREIAANPITRDSIIILNDVGDDLLARLYADCAFVVFPSFCEGYGLPIAEALGYGKPCISSDAGSLLEIGSDLVLRVDPKDTIGWSEKLAHYLASPAQLEEWGRRITAEHRPVTWDEAARRFFEPVRNLT